MEGDFSHMVSVLSSQYLRMLEDPSSREEICRSFVAVLSTGWCELWHLPSVVGGSPPLLWVQGR